MQLAEKSLVIWREVNNQMGKLARPIFYPSSNKLQPLEFVKGVLNALWVENELKSLIFYASEASLNYNKQEAER